VRETANVPATGHRVYCASGLQKRIGNNAIILLIARFTISSHAKTEVPVFLLAGQLQK
jgi:hypothetical protein